MQPFDIKNFSEKDIKEIIEFLENETIKVAVFGEFSTGKSTFINAILNEKILAKDYVPTTAVPTIISYSDLFNISVKMKNEKIVFLYNDDNEDKRLRKYIGKSAESILSLLKKKEKKIKSFIRKWTKEGEKANDAEQVNIYLPHNLISQKIEIIDTPGKNSEHKHHNKYTELVAKNTDIAIFLTSAREGALKKTELSFMNSVNKLSHKSFLVITWMDIIESETEKKDLYDFTQERLKKYWKEPILPELFGISPEKQLTDSKNKQYLDLNNNFKELIIKIKDVAINQRGKILLEKRGNPESKIFDEAIKLEKSKEPSNIDIALDYYQYLNKILNAANLPNQVAQDGINRCDKLLKQIIEKQSKIDSEYQNFKDSIDDKKPSLNVQYKKFLALDAKYQKLGEENSELKEDIKKTKSLLDEIELATETVNNHFNDIKKKYKKAELDELALIYSFYLDKLNLSLHKTKWSEQKQAKFINLIDKIIEQINIKFEEILNEIKPIKKELNKKIFLGDDEYKNYISKLELITLKLKKIKKDSTYLKIDSKSIIKIYPLANKYLGLTTAIIEDCKGIIKNYKNQNKIINSLQKKINNNPQYYLNRTTLLNYYNESLKIKNLIKKDAIFLTDSQKKHTLKFCDDIKKHLVLYIKNKISSLNESIPDNTVDIKKITQWLYEYNSFQTYIEKIKIKINQDVKLKRIELAEKQTWLIKTKRNINTFTNAAKKYINNFIIQELINKNCTGRQIINKESEFLKPFKTSFNTIKKFYKKNTINKIEKFTIKNFISLNSDDVSLEAKLKVLENIAKMGIFKFIPIGSHIHKLKKKINDKIKANTKYAGNIILKIILYGAVFLGVLWFLITYEEEIEAFDPIQKIKNIVSPEISFKEKYPHFSNLIAQYKKGGNPNKELRKILCKNDGNVGCEYTENDDDEVFSATSSLNKFTQELDKIKPDEFYKKYNFNELYNNYCNTNRNNSDISIIEQEKINIMLYLFSKAALAKCKAHIKEYDYIDNKGYWNQNKKTKDLNNVKDNIDNTIWWAEKVKDIKDKDFVYTELYDEIDKLKKEIKDLKKDIKVLN